MVILLKMQCHVSAILPLDTRILLAICAHPIEEHRYFRRKQSQGRTYLQIVASHRAGDQVRQRVIATLGRLDELEASGHNSIACLSDFSAL
jgi:hypothetical protein